MGVRSRGYDLTRLLAVDPGDLVVASGPGQLSRLPLSGVSGHVLTEDPAAPLGVSFQAPPNPPPGAPSPLLLTMPGPLTVRQGDSRITFPAAGTIAGIHTTAGTAPDGQPVVTDFLLNGSTSLYPVSANRPSIDVGANYSGLTVPGVTAVSAGDWLRMDTVQVGVQPVAAITYVASPTQASVFSGTTYTLNRPAGIRAGDLHIVWFRARGTGTWTEPAGAGWTKIGSGSGLSGSAKFPVWWRVDDGTPGPWTFTCDAATTGTFALNYVCRGQDTAPIGAGGAAIQASGSVANGATITPPALTTTSSNVRVVNIYYVDSSRVFTAPSGWTARSGFTGTASTTHVADMWQATASSPSAVDAGAVTHSGSTVQYQVTRIAIKAKPTPATWSPGEYLVGWIDYQRS